MRNLKAPPPLDRQLWEAISTEVIGLPDADRIAVADSCRRAENPEDSPLRDEDGRDGPPGAGLIYDVISLDARWSRWFNYLEDEGHEALTKLIEERAVEDANPFASRGFRWSQIDWPIIGRAIGSAILAIGYRDKWVYGRHDREIRDSATIWKELENEMRELNLEIAEHRLPNAAANDAINFLVQKNIDPTADIGRASDGPSSPMLSEGSFVRVNPNIHLIRDRIRARNLLRGGGGGGGAPSEDILGELCLEVISEALDVLQGGDLPEFAFRMHGLAAYMAVRRKVTIQKVGMHLFSSIAIRREIRNVSGLLVVDVANQLRTRFSIGKALETLHHYGIIDWGYVPKAIVDGAL